MQPIIKYITPGMGNSFKDWMKILFVKRRHALSIRYWHRLILVSIICFIFVPFQWYERARLRKKLAGIRLHEAPVFIIGHWRSGTTFLHNVLSQDKQFAWVTTLQSVFPKSFMTNAVFPGLTRFLMPPTRPIDDMKIHLESPQEEEMAMVNYGPYSLYHWWHFPKEMKDWYDLTIPFGGKGEVKWEKSYLSLLKKAALYWKRNRMLLKNPPNTGRLAQLLKLFPKARFVFIYRNPLDVYASTKKLQRKVISIFQLQKIKYEEVDENVLSVYKDLMQTYLRDRELIPHNQLIEVEYEHFKLHPLEGLEKIYKELEITGFEKNKKNFKKYIDTVSSYNVSHYQLPEEEEKLVRKEWRFAFKEWNYD